MQTFPYVEDYLGLLSDDDWAWLATAITPTTNRVTIKLARYDVQIVNNMSWQVLSGISLTDRQADLAVKLILKYRRQFAKFNIDVAPVETPSFRLPVRTIDRTKMIYLEDGIVKIRFPYDVQMVSDLRKFKETSQGRMEWHHDLKVWHCAVTEWNINWLVVWALPRGFDVGPEVLTLFDQILQAEKQPYGIQLVRTGDTYQVTHAADTLQAYIDQHLGNDLIKLVDHAGVLGYTVSADILEYCQQHYGPALEHIGTRHITYLSPDSDMMSWLFEYARLTDRYPICIYDPKLFDLDLSGFSSEEILMFDQNGRPDRLHYDINDVKIVYARKIPDNWQHRIPLLASTVEMMYGGRKLDWISRAEKIVYFSDGKLRATH